MEFRGVPVGPFHGRDAIAEAYRGQPPDDELRLLEHRERDGRTEARYAWLRRAGCRRGRAVAGRRGPALIRELVITFDRGVVWD